MLLKALLLTAILLAAGVLVAFELELKAPVMKVLDLLLRAGPVWFFVAMALLPVVGAPMSLFCLAAGSAFGSQLGMPLVTVLALAAIATNMALTWVLANRLLRPPLGALLLRLGFRLPSTESGDIADLVVLIRVTPGIPFPVQNYLLGLAAVPFIPYLIISSLIAFPLNAAFIFFGEALLHGRSRVALLGLLFVLAVMVAVNLVRRHYRAGISAAD